MTQTSRWPGAWWWALLVSGLGLAMVVWRWDWSAVPPTTQTPSLAAVERAQPARAAPDDVAPADATERTSGSLGGAAVVVPSAAAGRWFDILVVDALTQQPVADADAAYLDMAMWDRLLALPPIEKRAAIEDMDRHARTHGQRARSDRDGRLRLWMDRRGGQVFAQAGSRRGGMSFTEGDPPAEGYRLELGPDERLRVRVLDVTGRPAAGVPVGIWARTSEPVDAGAFDAPHHTLHTDPDGLVAFAYVQGSRVIQSGPQYGQRATRFEVGVAIAGLGVTPRDVDATAPMPPEPLELHLPATGALRVRFVIAGERLPMVETVGASACARDDRSARSQPVQQPVDAEGWAFFPHLPCGHPVFVEPEGRGVNLVSAAELPILAPGRLAQHQIDLADRAVVLHGRLLDPEGKPLADTSIRAACRSRGAFLSTTLQTDGAGWFLQLLSMRGQEPTMRLDSFEVAKADRPDLRAKLVARDVQIGRNELGDLVLGGEPLVCSGRFDQEVRPHHGVRLRVERFTPSRAAPDGEWQEVRDLAIGLDGGRSFAARGQVDAGPLRLWIESKEFLPLAPIEFGLGQDDLRVALQLGTKLAATCRVPEGVEHLHSWWLELVQPAPPPGGAASPTGSPEPRRAYRSRELPGEAVCQWVALEPGHYTMQVRVLGVPEPVLQIPDVVLPQPDGGDARLAAIDLRPLLRLVTLRREPSPDGKDHDLFAFVLPQAEPDSWIGHRLGLPGESLLLPRRALSLQLLCREGPPISCTIPAEAEFVDVARSRWPELEVRLAPGTVLPGGFDLIARLSPRDRPAVGSYTVHYGRNGSAHGALAELRQPAFAAVPLRIDGVTRLRIGDGVADLRLTLQWGTRQQDLQRPTPNEVVAGGQVTITLDPEELAAAAKALVAEVERK